MSVKLMFYGHSCWEIRAGDTSILIDPFLTGNPLAAVTADALTPDYIIVTHGHGDHVGDALTITQRSQAIVIAPVEVARYLQRQGCDTLVDLNIGGGDDFPFGRVKLTPALHSSSLPDGGYGGNPAGALITIEGKKIYHAGDTGLFYDMKLIGEEGIDVALLPIGDHYTMGPEDALRAVRLIAPKLVIPMHYDTFSVVKQDPMAFAQRVEAETGTSCVVLRPGESHSM